MPNDIYFVTGIGTEVGKTVVSAILTEALEADYWKPIQAGDLDHTDTDKVREWISNEKTTFHPEAFALQTPMSPHAAAEIDNIHIRSKAIKYPETTNTLIVEGAGGILVPINPTETIADLISTDCKVILVSRHYLGSINHTLLTVNYLRQRNFSIAGIIFNGEEYPSTEEIIKKMAGVRILGRINQEESVSADMIKKYVTHFRSVLG